MEHLQLGCCALCQLPYRARKPAGQSRLKLDRPETPGKRGGLAVMFIFKGAAHFGRSRSRKTKPVKRILSPSPR